MKLQRKGLTPMIFVLALGLTATACFKKEEAPKTEENMAPATGTTEEGAAPAAPAAPENGAAAPEAPKH